MPILEQETCVYPDHLLVEPPFLQPDMSEDDEPWQQRRWWAIYTKSRQEKALARHLISHEVPFYLPLIPKDNIIRGRRVRSHIPLFAGYVFLFGTELERVTTLTTNRTSRILPVVDQTRLRRDLANVHALIERNAPLSIERRLENGAMVRIKSGSLRGLEGVVVKRHGKTRLLVAVTYLQQGVSVEIDDCARADLAREAASRSTDRGVRICRSLSVMARVLSTARAFAPPRRPGAHNSRLLHRLFPRRAGRPSPPTPATPGLRLEGSG